MAFNFNVPKKDEGLITIVTYPISLNAANQHARHNLLSPFAVKFRKVKLLLGGSQNSEPGLNDPDYALFPFRYEAEGK